MRNATTELDGKDNTQLLATTPNGNTSGNNSKGIKRSRRSSSKKRSLPPEPPTYAVVRKPKKSLTPSLSDGKEMCMPITPLSGESSSLSASLEGPFTARESAHIYAQINRKSKGVSSTWSRSSSLPSRPTTLVSNPDLQTTSSYRALESFTRSLGRATQNVRRSGCESSGYSSLQESKETLLYDTCSRREKTKTGGSLSGVQPAALYRSLKEKGLCGRTEYDKLSRGVKEGTMETTDESLLRGYATLNGQSSTDTATVES